MAVDLELRYRGLRSPHKIKMGVSGCQRECAEARSKDVGVIATEKGWNLYVGGNGGATPKHAQLLAGDLDSETLVRYIDRYLMFYIRTADRLQRTAVWQETIEGGLDHIRAVVCEDSLGIAADLEAAMARHVDGYSDEWAGVLDDQEKLSPLRVVRQRARASRIRPSCSTKPARARCPCCSAYRASVNAAERSHVNGCETPTHCYRRAWRR